MKTTLICLGLAIALRLCFEAATGQTVEVPRTTPVRNLFDFAHTYVLKGQIALEWQFHEEARVWLEIKSADRQAWPTDGWHPSFTVVLVDYKPIVTQRGDKYEITFTQGQVQMP